MADTQDTALTQGLSTTTGSGTQGTTQNPQTASQQSTTPANQTSNVQPSAPNTYLTNVGGVPLQPTGGESISLASTTATTTTPTKLTVHHHPNGALLGFSGLLFVIAMVLFWSTSRTAKNTTK